MSNIANVYMGEGQYAKAIEFFEKALPILQQAGAQEEEANALAGLGGAYSMLSRFDKAAEILEQALTLARQTKNRQAESRHSEQPGADLRKPGQLRQSSEYVKPGAGDHFARSKIDREKVRA